MNFKNLNYFVVKTKFKHSLRSIAYSSFVQSLISSIIYAYMKLVFYSSKKIYIGEEKVFEQIREGKSIISAVWHNRLMMTPFISYRIKKINPNYKIFGLASRHGDGRFVTKVVEKFGSEVISGSTRHKNHSDRGITLSSFRKIFDCLNGSSSLVITPDGPRGPAQKINGKLIEIAQFSQTPILPISVSASKFFRLNSWDKFYIPLPFSRLCYYFGEPITIDKDLNKDALNKMHIEVEQKMIEVENKSQIATTNS